MAAKRYGLGPVHSSGSRPYGCSVDYSVYPPILDVFKIEDEFSDEEKNYMVEMDKLKRQAEAVGGEAYVFKTMLAVGDNVVARYMQGVEPSSAHFRSPDSWEKEKAKRSTCVDVDGNPLRVVSDVTDMVLDKLPSEIRSGTRVSWKAVDSNSGGRASLVTVIYQIIDNLSETYGPKIIPPAAVKDAMT